MVYLQQFLLLLLIICFQLPSTVIGQETAATKYFLEKTRIPVKPFSLETARNGNLITSNLEKYRNLYAALRNLATQQYYNNYETNYKFIANAGKLQPQISPLTPFPCGLNNTRSLNSPNSVHQLRPGDIDIIGVLGDSLSAGSVMMSKNLNQGFVEFRGQTALGGGLKDWRSILTLPNILKVFNSDLYGYAVGNTLGKSRQARFNTAEPFGLTQDMPYMAEVLIKRLQTDPKVKMAEHWKMISVFIGSNDVCNQVCYYDNTDDYLESHRKDLYRTLTLLRDNIPRLIVNLIIMPDLDIILPSMKNISPQCDYSHKTSCFCLVGNSLHSRKIKANRELVLRIQQIDMEIAGLPEFQLEQFAVVPRSFAVNKSIPKLENGGTDFRYFAIDCFHFSQYGNAGFTTMLWDDMLQVKTKPTKEFLKPFEIFLCPSSEKPFISTLKNI